MALKELFLKSDASLSMGKSLNKLWCYTQNYESNEDSPCTAFQNSLKMRRARQRKWCIIITVYVGEGEMRVDGWIGRVSLILKG